MILSKEILTITCLILCLSASFSSVFAQGDSHISYFKDIQGVWKATPSNNLQSDVIPEARLLIKSLMKEKQIPGLSVAVANKDSLLWVEGFGYADLENKSSVEIETKFRIGSISKSLTAVAIAKLYELNLLDLNDSVQKYVPYFPQKKWPVTIAALLSHTAGIRDYNYQKGEFLNRINYSSVEASIEVFKNDSLLFEPGTKFSYSTYGYVLLSAVIEGASGLNFLQFMQDSVFTPLRLEHTLPDQNSNIIQERARFYDISDGELVNGYFVDNSNKWAGGGYLSTSYDLVRFGQHLLTNQFLEESTTQLLWTPATLTSGEKTNYGMGWRINYDSLGRRYVHHGGSSIGGRSFILIYPEQELIIAITSNLSTNFDQNFVIQVANLFFGDS